MSAVDLAVPTQPQLMREGVSISTARNSWTQWALQIDGAQLPAKAVLHLPKFPPELVVTAFQILPAPVQMNDAQYIRQTGDRGDTLTVPRVLFPLPIKETSVDLSALRDPAHPADSNGHPTGGPLLIWLDLHVAEQTPAGVYSGTCELQDARGGETAGSVPIHLNVDQLTLPTESHLHFSASLDWQALATLKPDLFNGITPRLLNRSDTRHAAVIALLDQYVQLAHQNKADLYVPRIQPIVKWPLGKAPEVDWTGYDSVVSPWFDGSAFTDGFAVPFSPLPEPDSLTGFDLPTQAQYWHVAADHFDKHRWLDRSPVVLKAELAGPVNQAGAIFLSVQAHEILGSHPQIDALLPAQDDQLQLISSTNRSGIAPASTSRLRTLGPGVVSASPLHPWPTDALPPLHWIDGQSQATSGLSTEQSARTRAWLAFDRDATLVLCGSCLPITRANQVQHADQAPWFYPGQWFGLDMPLATLQLKWTRQAEQDYEYLHLASLHNDRETALKMCELITRPLELQPGQATDPVFDILAGSVESHACEEGRQLLVARLLRASGFRKIINGSTDPVELQTLRWFAERQHPTVVGSSVNWLWNLNSAGRTSPGNAFESNNWIDAAITCDVYNPADPIAAGSLEWTNFPPGWDGHPDPVEVPQLDRYQVRSVGTVSRFNLNSISAESRQPVELTFIDGFNGRTFPCKVMVPIAISERRKQPITIDGLLNDWFPADAIQLDQPLVKMMDRPALQSSELPLADSNASVFTAWSNDHFYVAFRLGGVSASDLRSTRNFVQYDHSRAWGEDLCELLIQPIYTDNSTGPTLHLIAKPGGEWTEQQSNTSGSWKPFEASGVRYASGVDPAEKIWRGELAIPWRAIESQGRGRPFLLRFNFIQHQNSTGQSASWAGPIDQSRDGKMTGLLVLKEP